ncbi:MAG: radical SAM family heme chaperone HemW [Oscillospiraceae bacterium]|nr:radical SAM family heme chaperone HemW [Oscillospiraceae bacterium]
MSAHSPVGIYIHIPFCAKKCPYCDFYTRPYHKDTVSSYVDALCRNIIALPASLTADTVYFGGGTPSLLHGDAVLRILQCLHQRLCIPQEAEITLEANPCTMTPQALSQWKAAGINRLSVGVQSFVDAELTQLGRNHTAQKAIAAITNAAQVGFDNLSLDLMLGTPLQTSDSLAKSIQTALSLPITHLSAYLLKIEEGTPFGQSPPAIADADTAADYYAQLSSAMHWAGFVHYEISNYAKPGYESRHNCKYWLCQPYIGLGAAAHSCYQGKRSYVPDDLQGFISSPLQAKYEESPVACDDEERIMLGLRLSQGISLDDFPQKKEQLLRKAAPLIPRYLTYHHGRLSLTEDGMLVSNAVIVHLLDA